MFVALWISTQNSPTLYSLLSILNLHRNVRVGGLPSSPTGLSDSRKLAFATSAFIAKQSLGRELSVFRWSLLSIASPNISSSYYPHALRPLNAIVNSNWGFPISFDLHLHGYAVLVELSGSDLRNGVRREGSTEDVRQQRLRNNFEGERNTIQGHLYLERLRARSHTTSIFLCRFFRIIRSHRPYTFTWEPHETQRVVLSTLSPLPRWSITGRFETAVHQIRNEDIMNSTPNIYLDLSRIDSSSSIDSNATAPNLPGPGRNVGNLYDGLGGKLESVMNNYAARFRRSSSRTTQDDLQVAHLDRVDAVHPEIAGDLFDSASSIDTDATAPNLPGAGRTVGLFLDFVGERLETAMSAMAIQLRLDPENVVRAIRQICQHDDRPLFRRHKTPPELSKAELKSLKKLCKKLIEFTRSRVRRTQFQALEEIMKLCVEDPLIRDALSGCDLGRLAPKYREQDLAMTHSRALQCIAVEIYEITCIFTELHFPGGQKEPRSIYIEAYSYMWGQYMKTAYESPGIIEWSNVNSCIAQLSPLALQHQTDLVESKSYIKDLAWSFYRAPQEMSSIVDKFLKKPRIECDARDLSREDAYTFTAVHDWSLDSLVHIDFLVDFVQKLSGGPLEDAKDQIAFIQTLRATASGKFDATVFAEEIWFAYCHLSLFALSGEHISRNSTDNSGSLVPSQSWKWDDFLSSILCLETCLENAGTSQDKVASSFLLSRFASLDRYCKIALWATTANHMPMSRLLLSPELAVELNSLVDEGEWDPFSTIYYRGRFLFRFQSEGQTHVVDGSAMKGQLSKFIRSQIDRELSVDVMAIERDMAMWHPATRLSFGEGSNATPYDATGHFPILAGLKASGEELYIARSKFYRSFACVAEGDSTICVEGRLGKDFEEDIFSVLCLRHDPCDSLPPYPHRSKGGKDSTGPLSWIRFWPDKDVDFPAHHYNTEELIRLETFLNVFSKTVNGEDLASRARKFKDALYATAPSLNSSSKADFWRKSAFDDDAPIFHDDLSYLHLQGSVISPYGFDENIDE
ncbi:hypothetical protein SCHPADRAFT_886159 [Schizopora paradoxa]|uniref:Uncharacterized protein n=1 Tax=Schizopora paradoxa TaxID=27342 RepID=A0A0H2SN00_9AGAM|nr:hypothetical protein SCHPADRAFT_886159 [Schizopora paradoxa]